MMTSEMCRVNLGKWGYCIQEITQLGSPHIGNIILITDTIHNRSTGWLMCFGKTLDNRPKIILPLFRDMYAEAAGVCYNIIMYVHLYFPILSWNTGSYVLLLCARNLCSCSLILLADKKPTALTRDQ